MWHRRILHAVDTIHLVYLGLLPALATFFILAIYGHPAPMLLFLGGTVAVSVYLAVVASYTRPARSLTVALFVLFDGPLWAALSQLAGSVSLSFAIDAFLIDCIATWLAIVWLAITASQPSREQRIATLGFALVAVGSILFASWPYVREHIIGQWMRLFWLVAGILEAVVARHYLLETDVPVRETMTSARYIGILLFVWIAALCAGNILHG